MSVSSSGAFASAGTGPDTTTTISIATAGSEVFQVQPVKYDSENALLDRATAIAETCKDVTTHDWTARVKSLKEFAGLVAAGAAYESVWPQVCQVVRDSICAQALDLRSSVVKEACNLIVYLAKALEPDQLDHLGDVFFTNLLKVVSASSSVIVQCGEAALRALVAAWPLSKSALTKLTEYTLQSKSTATSLRRAIAMCCLVSVSNFGSSAAFERTIPTFDTLLSARLADKDPSVRAVAREAFIVYAQVQPHKAEKLKAQLDRSVQKAIDGDLTTSTSTTTLSSGTQDLTKVTRALGSSSRPSFSQHRDSLSASKSVTSMLAKTQPLSIDSLHGTLTYRSARDDLRNVKPKQSEPAHSSMDLEGEEEPEVVHELPIDEDDPLFGIVPSASSTTRSITELSHESSYTKQREQKRDAFDYPYSAARRVPPLPLSSVDLVTPSSATDLSSAHQFVEIDEEGDRFTLSGRAVSEVPAKPQQTQPASMLHDSHSHQSNETRRLTLGGAIRASSSSVVSSLITSRTPGRAHEDVQNASSSNSLRHFVDSASSTHSLATGSDHYSHTTFLQGGAKRPLSAAAQPSSLLASTLSSSSGNLTTTLGPASRPTHTHALSQPHLSSQIPQPGLSISRQAAHQHSLSQTMNLTSAIKQGAIRPASALTLPTSALPHGNMSGRDPLARTQPISLVQSFAGSDSQSTHQVSGIACPPTVSALRTGARRPATQTLSVDVNASSTSGAMTPARPSSSTSASSASRLPQTPSAATVAKEAPKTATSSASATRVLPSSAQRRQSIGGSVSRPGSATANRQSLTAQPSSVHATNLFGQEPTSSAGQPSLLAEAASANTSALLEATRRQLASALAAVVTKKDWSDRADAAAEIFALLEDNAMLAINVVNGVPGSDVDAESASVVTNNPKFAKVIALTRVNRIIGPRALMKLATITRQRLTVENNAKVLQQLAAMLGALATSFAMSSAACTAAINASSQSAHQKTTPSFGQAAEKVLDECVAALFVCLARGKGNMSETATELLNVLATSVPDTLILPRVLALIEVPSTSTSTAGAGATASVTGAVLAVDLSVSAIATLRTHTLEYLRFLLESPSADASIHLRTAATCRPYILKLSAVITDGQSPRSLRELATTILHLLFNISPAAAYSEVQRLNDTQLPKWVELLDPELFTSLFRSPAPVAPSASTKAPAKLDLEHTTTQLERVGSGEDASELVQTPRKAPKMPLSEKPADVHEESSAPHRTPIAEKSSNSNAGTDAQPESHNETKQVSREEVLRGLVSPSRQVPFSPSPATALRTKSCIADASDDDSGVEDAHDLEQAQSNESGQVKVTETPKAKPSVVKAMTFEEEVRSCSAPQEQQTETSTLMERATTNTHENQQAQLPESTSTSPVAHYDSPEGHAGNEENVAMHHPQAMTPTDIKVSEQVLKSGATLPSPATPSKGSFTTLRVVVDQPEAPSATHAPESVTEASWHTSALTNIQSLVSEVKSVVAGYSTAHPTVSTSEVDAVVLKLLTLPYWVISHYAPVVSPEEAPQPGENATQYVEALGVVPPSTIGGQPPKAISLTLLAEVQGAVIRALDTVLALPAVIASLQRAAASNALDRIRYRQALERAKVNTTLTSALQGDQPMSPDGKAPASLLDADPKTPQFTVDENDDVKEDRDATKTLSIVVPPTPLPGSGLGSAYVPSYSLATPSITRSYGYTPLAERATMGGGAPLSPPGPSLPTRMFYLIIRSPTSSSKRASLSAEESARASFGAKSLKRLPASLTRRLESSLMRLAPLVDPYLLVGWLRVATEQMTANAGEAEPENGFAVPTRWLVRAVDACATEHAAVTPAAFEGCLRSLGILACIQPPANAANPDAATNDAQLLRKDATLSLVTLGLRLPEEKMRPVLSSMSNVARQLYQIYLSRASPNASSATSKSTSPSNSAPTAAVLAASESAGAKP